MAGQLDVRQVQHEEAPAIADLVRRAYSIYAPRMDRPPAPILADYATLIGQGVAFVVPRQDRLAAVLVLWPARDHLLLENIAVDPADQSTGLGRQLMHFVAQYAVSLGLVAVDLYTNEVMPEILAFLRMP